MEIKGRRFNLRIRGLAVAGTERLAAASGDMPREFHPGVSDRERR